MKPHRSVKTLAIVLPPALRECRHLLRIRIAERIEKGNKDGSICSNHVVIPSFEASNASCGKKQAYTINKENTIANNIFFILLCMNDRRQI